MSFFQIYIQAFLFIMILMSALWIISIFIKNVSIVDLFWGPGFVLAGFVYFLNTEGFALRKLILISLLTIWGLRLFVYITWRNHGKGEDFRYQNFRKDYGEHRYWWVSFFQTFLLQGVLMWLISVPLLGAMYFKGDSQLNLFDYLAILVWIVGFAFEAGGDFQLARFKRNPENKGKVLNKGFWKYTRHPNYFGDATLWWGYGLFSIAAGCYIPIIGSLLMTLLIIKVSGVSLLEKTLKNSKPQYREYIESTSSFFPWFPKKQTK